MEKPWEPLESCSWSHLKNKVLVLEGWGYSSAEVSRTSLRNKHEERVCFE